MAGSPPNTDPVMTQIDATSLAALHALNAKHVNVSYTLIGVILFLVLACCGGGYIASKMYDREIQRAEAAEKVANDAQAQMAADRVASNQLIQQATQQIAESQKLLAQNAATIASLQQQIANRDTQAQQTINNIMAAGKSAQQAYVDASAHYNLKSPFAPGKDATGAPTLTFAVPDVQDFTATKVDDVVKTADLADKTTQLNTANNSIVSLQADLKIGQSAFTALQKTEDQCEVTVKDKQKALDDYKKAAVLTKWQRFKQGFEKMALFMSGVAIGHKL